MATSHSTTMWAVVKKCIRQSSVVREVGEWDGAMAGMWMVRVDVIQPICIEVPNSDCGKLHSSDNKTKSCCQYHLHGCHSTGNWLWQSRSGGYIKIGIVWQCGTWQCQEFLDFMLDNGLTTLTSTTNANMVGRITTPVKLKWVE